MSIRPVDFNGMLQRTEDVSIIKHHEDAKPVVDQQNIQVSLSKQEDELNHRVNEQQESEGMENHADAREEGKGVYYNTRKKKNGESHEVKSDGQVIRKVSKSVFDIKI